jgi:potassium-transporting ATPase potassium-binding subunit
LSEVLYAFASPGQQQRLGVRRLRRRHAWYNDAGIAMLVGRFFLIIPALAIAGSLARKQAVPVTAGTFPTGTPLFGGLVAGVVRDRRRPDVLPRPGARPHRRAALMSEEPRP